jgi:hypothetical protein
MANGARKNTTSIAGFAPPALAPCVTAGDRADAAAEAREHVDRSLRA